MEKIRVDIIGSEGIKSSKKYPIVGNSVEIEKKTGKRPSYRPKFSKDCILPYFTGKWIFKKINFKLMLKEGANECINYYSGDKVNVPTCDRKAIKDYFDAHVVKHAGATTQKIQIPMLLYVGFIAVIILQVIGILLQTGRIRIV